jgi:Ni,Fe-hydrogenase III small subunit/ferredoxin-like protein FixX
MSVDLSPGAWDHIFGGCMFEILKIKAMQGKQYIPDVKKAQITPRFRGFPIIDAQKTGSIDFACPANAILKSPLRVDMGKCVFCGECEKATNGAIKFSTAHKLSADSADKLIISAGMTAEEYEKNAVECSKEIKKVFGRSLKLRQVSAGGCNGCELELNACGNVNFDMGRFGIDFVASPRHADGIVITGPITKNMAAALEDTWKSIAEPKIIIVTGACAISGGIFAGSEEINREFFNNHKVDLYVPGCPIHPLTFINGVLGLIGR